MSAHGARDVGQLSALAPAFRAGPHTEARRRPPVPGVAEKGVVRPCVKSQALGTLTQFKIRCKIRCSAISVPIRLLRDSCMQADTGLTNYRE